MPPGRFPNLAPAATGRSPAEVGRPAGGPLVRRRFHGASVSLYEWHCRGHGPAQPSEEWTDAYEVVVPRRGAFQWEIAGERVLADPGTATFLHPAEPYRVRHPLPGGDAGSVFRMAAWVLRDLLGEHDPSAAERAAVRFPASHAPLDGRAYLLHRLALRAAADPAAGPVEVEERAMAFLREALRQTLQWRPAGRARRPVPRSRLAVEYAARVAEVVAAGYREPLTLAGIARAVGVSPFHLSRLVTAAAGVPIHRMILRRRLREALELLLDSRQSISQIALEVGFASHSHLTDAFRREYGVPPRAVRKGARPGR